MTPLACPVHKVTLTAPNHCQLCGFNYPQVRGIPILINEQNSVFRIEDYLAREREYGGASSYAGSLDERKGIRQAYRRIMHRISESGPSSVAISPDEAIQKVRSARPNAKTLVIGAGDAVYAGDITYTDVAVTPHIACVADAHDLPFVDASFDLCILVAVLEHVADPWRCVEEVRRVLRPGGYVYAVTPFLQPVHMGAHDFTRFTFVGHRRLFRHFDDVASGIALGPAASTAYVLRSLLNTAFKSPFMKSLSKAAGLLMTHPLRYLDRFIVRRSAAYEGASAFYFFGSLRSAPLTDREILLAYRG